MYSQLKYQLTLMMRTPRAVIFGVVAPALLLALQSNHRHASAATVAGLTVFGMLNLAYLTHTAGLVLSREDGVLRRWYASPLPRWQYFAGRILSATLLTDAAALILLLVGAAMGGLHLTGAAVGCLLIAATLGGITLASAGTALTPMLPPGQGVYQILAITYLPLLLFAGGLGGIGGLPHWLTTLNSYLPVQPVVNAATQALQHSALIPGRDLLVLAAWAAGSLLLATRFFRWDPTRPAHARRRTTSTTARSA
jgi:ABC-2 type transport system permease protein